MTKNKLRIGFSRVLMIFQFITIRATEPCLNLEYSGFRSRETNSPYNPIGGARRRLSSRDRVQPYNIRDRPAGLREPHDESMRNTILYDMQQHVYRVAISPQCSWPKVWNFALDYGSQGTTCSLAFLKLFSLHVFSDNSCFVHNCPHHVTNETIAAHVLADHMSLNINIDQCVDVITSCSDDIMTYGNTLIQCF